MDEERIEDMIPFKNTYYENKLREFNDKCKITKNTKIDEYEIDFVRYFSGKIPAYMYVYNGEYSGYPRLKKGDDIWMAITPLEIGGCFEPARRAQGRVGVVGLGLGYFVQEIIDKEKVSEVVVYEMNKEVIELYNKNFDFNPKLKIVEEDAFFVKDEKFDFFFVDIYTYKLSDIIAEHYKIFNENLDIGQYAFWGLERFILSCDINEVEKINFPDSWIAMTDNLGDRFYQSRYKENFVPYDYRQCNSLLKKFREIFGLK